MYHEEHFGLCLQVIRNHIASAQIQHCGIASVGISDEILPQWNSSAHAPEYPYVAKARIIIRLVITVCRSPIKEGIGVYGLKVHTQHALPEYSRVPDSEHVADLIGSSVLSVVILTRGGNVVDDYLRVCVPALCHGVYQFECR